MFSRGIISTKFPKSKNSKTTPHIHKNQESVVTPKAATGDILRKKMFLNSLVFFCEICEISKNTYFEE